MQATIDARQPDLPMVVRASAGILLSPHLRIIDRTLLLLIRMQSELGFTPTSRARLKDDDLPPASGAAEADRWASLRVFPVIDGGKR